MRTAFHTTFPNFIRTPPQSTERQPWERSGLRRPRLTLEPVEITSNHNRKVLGAERYHRPAVPR